MAQRPSPPRFAVLAVLCVASSGCAAERAARKEPAPRAASPSATLVTEAAPPLYPDDPVEAAPSRTLLASRFETRVVEPAGPPAADGSSVFRRSRRGAPIDLDLKDADIANVCRLLADVGRVNIVLADDVHANVTLRLRRVPWDRALDAILRTKGFRAEREGNLITVFAK